MIAKIAFKIGRTDYELTLDDDKEMELFHKMAVLGNPPRRCNVCGNDKYFRLDSNKDKDGNIYVNVVCTAASCYAKSKLGQYKSGGYFWHNFEKYEGKKSEEDK